jgi:hypothetical protein
MNKPNGTILCIELYDDGIMYKLFENSRRRLRCIHIKKIAKFAKYFEACEIFNSDWVSLFDYMPLPPVYDCRTVADVKTIIYEKKDECEIIINRDDDRIFEYIFNGITFKFSGEIESVFIDGYRFNTFLYFCDMQMLEDKLFPASIVRQLKLNQLT